MRKVNSALQLKVGDNHLTCSKCGQVKELKEENFYKNDRSPVGFMTVCKECKKKYYRSNKEKKLIYQYKYFRENREYYKEYMKIYARDKNKAKSFTIEEYKKRKNLEKFL